MMQKTTSILIYALFLAYLPSAYAGIEGLPESVDAEQQEALLEAPTAAEVETARLLDEAQLLDGQQLPNVLLSKEQIKRAKQAIKTLTISDFILQKYDQLQTPSIVDLSTAMQYQSNFPSLTVTNQYAVQLSRLLFNDFATQAKSLPFYSKPIRPEDTAGGWDSKADAKSKDVKAFGWVKGSWEANAMLGWDVGAWQLDGENAIKSPELEDLSSYPKVWAGPVVSDMTRYHKKNDKMIARVYFNGGEYSSSFQPIMQGIWALAKRQNLSIAVSIDTSTNVHELSYPLQFKGRIPLYIVTPDGLVPAMLVSARLNNSGECNTGNWFELELENEKPIAMWAFLALPKPELAKSILIKRETYVPNTFKYDQEYMVGTRKVLALSWKGNLLPSLKIIATRFDYNLEKYDDKGKLNSKSTLGSTWGSEVFLDNKVVTQVKDSQNKMVDSVNYGDKIHSGEFGDCPTR